MSGRLHRLWPTFAVFSGLGLLYLGERLIGGDHLSRYLPSALGALLIVAAVGTRAQELNAAPADRRRVSTWLLTCTGGAAASMLGYAALLMFAGDDGAARTRELGTILWIVLLAVSLCPLIALEVAVYPVAWIPQYEARRTSAAFERGLAFGLLLTALCLINFLANRHELKEDLSFGKRAEASTITKGLVRDLSQPVRVTLFFPEANEVAEQLEDYLASLKNLSSNFTVDRMDQALGGKRSTDTGVSENGWVAVSHEKSHEKWKVGLKTESARSALKTFDSKFSKAVVKVTRSKKLVYFTVGHSERSTSPDAEDKRGGLATLKKVLDANQYDVKHLGLGEGLGSELPKDAQIIFIMGPEKPFLPSEIDALKEGIRRGVRLFITLEAEREGEPLNEILAELGIEFHREALVANDRAYVKVTGTEADKYYLATNRYSSHGSVTIMSRNASQLYTIFAKSGYLTKLDGSPVDVKVDMIIRAMDGSWADLDGDSVLDRPDEKTDSYGLAAAVTKTSSNTETRAVVFADSDLFTDKYLPTDGSKYLIAEVAGWLADVKDPILPEVTEEDVKIQHRKEEDIVWFYSTTLIIPLLVAGFGVFWIGRRPKR